MSASVPETNGSKQQQQQQQQQLQQSDNRQNSIQVTSMGLSTKCSNSGTKPSDWAHKPIMPPLYLSTTFEVLEPGNAPYDYSRSANPTRDELEKYLALIESARFGLAFASGLGCMTTISYLLECGQHILCGDDVYGGTYRLFTRCVSRMGIETSYVDDSCNLDAWRAKFRPGKTKLVWIETPTNPMMKVTDIEAVCRLIKSLDPSCVVAIDNTFMTPVFQSPLKLGADLVVHSCSKYIGGHSDIIMGALMTNDQRLFDQLKFYQNSLGIVPAPYDCSQMIRSIKTLEIRVLGAADNAAKVAAFLEAHPNVVGVLYPGLKSHPQHELIKRQCSGFSAMLSMYLRELKGDEAVRLMNAVKIFHPAESLGCVCSLIEVPALMTHTIIPADVKAKLGLTNNLVRISVGIENVQDLIGDLGQALETVYGA